MEDTLQYPHSAWLWNYAAGWGRNNFPTERMLGDELNRVGPGMVFSQIVAANAAFVFRAVSELHDQGVKQFIDLGPGIPANAREELPTHPKSLYGTVLRDHDDARVVYVDHDPLVLTHARALRDVAGQVLVIEGDIFEPKQVLDHADLEQFIDRDKPIGLICTGVLHEHSGAVAEVAEVMATYADWLPGGSFTVISHLLDTEDKHTKDIVEPLQQILQGTTGRCRFRTLAEIVSLFPQQELLDPGVVRCRQWRNPDYNELLAGQDWIGIAGGVGRVLDPSGHT
ncbi:SAM-dependent methyltransferase [Kribbella sp. NPDC051587]|uniref:SAM-dependent methyltransferase n=1 Tax=Kribbella sp. NPDC051587 TaxID=3364119 RepID=UPI00379FE81F